MAIRAKLSAPREDQTVWPWHTAKWSAISASTLLRGDRRMEAASYLSGGYGIRLSLAGRPLKPCAMSKLATAWQPSRLKGIQLNKEFGTPFLAATQVFDLRPRPRKFLSLDRTAGSTERFIENGTIVITCSGSVGRATLIYAAHEGVLISHDLLRITPTDPMHWGWLYAFFRSSLAFEMMTSAQYGHMIKHLEPSHIHDLPVPLPRDDILAEFQGETQRILDLRNEAWRLQQAAEKTFSDAVGDPDPAGSSEVAFTVSAKSLLGRRRRLEATFYSPEATNIFAQFNRAGLRVDKLGAITDGVWWMTRFKRIFGDEGDRYLSADELFSVNPGITKKVIVEQAENPDSYRVKAGWIVMACSGQTYGLNGSVSLMTMKHEDAFFSHDLIRIIPREGEVRPGYLFTALGHPELGRPLVIRNAYGTSIPHLDPEDVAETPIVRLKSELEDRVADLAEEAARLRVLADDIENAIAERADNLLHAFMAGDTQYFNVAKAASV